VTSLTVSDRPSAQARTDALVLGIVSGAKGASLAAGHGLSAAGEEHVHAAMKTLSTKAKPEEIVRLTAVPEVAAGLVVLVGLGSAPTAGTAYELVTLRRAAGAATRALAGTAKVALRLPVDGPAQVGAVAEGALYGAYEFGAHRGKSAAKVPVKAVTVLAPSARDKRVKAAVRRVEVLASAVGYVRDLVNTAPNELYPETFAASVRERANGTSVKVAVMDEKALVKAGCGGIVGVGQGSARPPRMVTMTYAPAGAKAHLALVGKGITFDSGGLCIKPGASMVTMKCDMAGAASVAAAVQAVAELELPVAVTGYLCLAENMTGSLAQRPGDVVTMRGGRTVEIINTDAEGRLVLADGLVLAGEQKPDAIIDIATLTGAAVVALGDRTAAVMANDDGFRRRVCEAAADAGEEMWPMPLPEETRPKLDSLVADIKHTADRAGGMLTAASFLKEFIAAGDGEQDQIPWAHIDIAGPAYNDHGPHGYTPKGGTGFGTRTLVALVEAHA